MMKVWFTLLLTVLCTPVLYGQGYYETTVLATDKDVYRASDTAYVAGMVCAPHLLVPSELSNYCYIELSKEDGTLIERQKIRCVGSAFYARFSLRQISSSLCLVFRAYTRFMQNFPSYTWGKAVIGVGTGNRYPVFAAQSEEVVKELTGTGETGWKLSADTLGARERMSVAIHAGKHEMQLLCRVENVRKNRSSKLSEALRTFKAQGSEACGQILSGVWQYRFLPEEVLSVRGQVITASGKPYRKGGTVVAYVSDTGFTYDVDVDGEGRFEAGVDDFKDGECFFIQAYDKKGKYRDTRVEVCMDSFPPAETVQVAWKEYAGLYAGSTLTSLTDTIVWMSEVNVTARTPNVEEPGSRAYSNYFDEKKIRDWNYTELEQIIRAMPGVRVVEAETGEGTIGKVVLSTRGTGVLSQPPIVHFYVDGSWALHEDLRSVVNVQDIASIEYIPVVRAMALYGSRAFNGVIVIKTLTGKEKVEVEPEGITYVPKGLSNNTSFSPEVPLQVFKVPADSTCMLSFDAPSYPGSYRVVLEGVENGRSLLYKELPFEVVE